MKRKKYEKEKKMGAPLRRRLLRRLALASGLHSTNSSKWKIEKKEWKKGEKNKKWGKRGRAANGWGCEFGVEGWRSFSGGK